jgi:hypothetical protein
MLYPDMKGNTSHAPPVTRFTMVAGVEVGSGRALMKFCARRKAPLVLTS